MNTPLAVFYPPPPPDVAAVIVADVTGAAIADVVSAVAVAVAVVAVDDCESDLDDEWEEMLREANSMGGRVIWSVADDAVSATVTVAPVAVDDAECESHCERADDVSAEATEASSNTDSWVVVDGRDDDDGEWMRSAATWDCWNISDIITIAQNKKQQRERKTEKDREKQHNKLDGEEQKTRV